MAETEAHVPTTAEELTLILADARVQATRVVPTVPEFERFAFENTIPRLITDLHHERELVRELRGMLGRLCAGHPRAQALMEARALLDKTEAQG